jgi:hypothetical protein
MTDEEIGHGTAIRYGCLTLTDGMTVGEILTQLASMPVHAKVGVLLRVEQVDAKRIRIPVEVNRVRAAPPTNLGENK